MAEPSDAEICDIVNRLTLEEKVRLLTGRDSWSTHAIPQIGLRSMVLSDGPAGVRGAVWDERSPSVNFPSPTALAASWDRDVVRGVGEGLGAEAREKGVDVVLAPTINLHRSPYGGRHFEAFSEDPILTSELASEYVRGIQSHGVGATVKHYVANESETDRFTVDVRVEERALRELYLLAFEAPVVEGGSWLVMSAYNSINGVTATENKLLTTPLNDEWGFDGVVVSDWTAVRSIESARRDQDLAMPGPHGAWGEALLRSVREGEVPETAIDRKVARILRLADRVGALNGGAGRRPAPKPVDGPPLARLASAAGTVMLRNAGALPLDAPATIALIGEGAADARTQGGGSATVIPRSVVSPWEGLRRRWPAADIAWARGAAVQTRPSDLPIGSFTTTNGDPGMTVRYIDERGEELLREQRQVSGIVSFDALSPATRAAVIEMVFRYSPPRGSSARLAVSGLCDFEVYADRIHVASGSVRTQPGDDPATAVLTPPFALVDVPTSGEAVDVSVRFTPVAGGIPDSFAFRVGVPPMDADDEALIAEAVELAAGREVAIVVVSTSPEVESEGFDRADLRLPGRQDDLVRAVVGVNPNTIVIVNAGAPVILPWREDVAAILAVWFPGQEFGDALADILSGDVEPGGRLPVTWPSTETDVPVQNVTPTGGRLEYSEGIHIGYRAWRRAAHTPAYAFGTGLGYTEFEVRSLGASESVRAGDDLTVHTVVANIGDRAGKAVVQLYAERMSESSIDRPDQWLVGFSTAMLEPGEQRRLSLHVPWRRLAHWSEGWQIEPGTYRLTSNLASDLPGATALVRVFTGEE